MIGLRTRTAALLAALSLGVAPAALGAPAVAPADPVDLGGTPVESPSTDPQNRTELTAGLWSDTIPGGVQHEFEYHRTVDNSTVHVGVVGTSGADSSDQVAIEGVVDGQDGEVSCDSNNDSSAYNTPAAPFGTQIFFGPDEPDDLESACLRSDVVKFSVGRGYSSAQADLPVAIKVVEEAPTDTVDGLPAPPENPPSFRKPADGSPGPVEGATSFEDAPLLKDGSYEDAAVEGADRVYRVSVGWGQTLSVALAAPALTAAQLEETFGSGPDVQLSLFNPLRNNLADNVDGTEPGGSTGEEPLRVTTAAGPVRYLDRYDQLPTYLPGDYWVVVSVEPNPETGTDARKDLTIDYTLSVQVQGEETGAPTYATTDDFTKPFLVGEDAFSTVASGNPAPAAEDEAASGTRRFAALGLGLFGLVCCVLGALQLRRR